MTRSFQLALMAAAIIVSTIPGPVQAQRSIASLFVKTSLNQDGTLSVVQTLTATAPLKLNWKLSSQPQHLSIRSDGQELEESQHKVFRREKGWEILTENHALQWEISYLAKANLVRANERDQIFFQVLNEPGYFIKEVRSEINLPIPISEQLNGNVYAIGGITDAENVHHNNQSLVYAASGAGPKSILTINAHWPSNAIVFNQSQEIRLALLGLEALPWLLLGIILPLITAILLLILILHLKSREAVNMGEVSSPPSKLSPLVVGVLVNKKIYPQEIVAMIIDLCQRGYLVIVKRAGRYYLSQRRTLDEYLEPWERAVLEELFSQKNDKVTEEAASELNRSMLYSLKVKEAFLSVYENITAQRFFQENPHLSRVRFKLLALVFYFLGFFGAIWVAVSDASPYLLLPLLGTILMAQAVIKLSPSLVKYTPVGREARDQWVSFGQYLAQDKPLPFESSRNQIFEKYLPYAIALRRSKQWAKRFDDSGTTIIKPEWFITYETGEAGQFANEVESFTSKISSLLSNLRGPKIS